MDEPLILEPVAVPQPEAASSKRRPRVVRRLKYLKRRAERKFGWLASLVQFGLVGLTGMAIDLAVFLSLAGLMSVPAARALAIAVAMTWNYLLNRRLTFAHAARQPFWKQYLLFSASCLVGAAVNWGTSVTLCLASDWFMNAKGVAAVIGIAAGFLFNFALSHRWVFRS